MRITIATRIYAPEPAAAAFRLEALVSALARRGHAIKVVTVTPPPALQKEAAVSDRSQDGVTARRFPVLRDADQYVRGYLQYLSFDIPLLFRLLTGRRPAAIVVEPPPTSGLVARIAAAFRRVPLIYFAADIWSDAATATDASRVVTAMVRIAEQLALRGATRVIAVSDGVAGRVRELSGHDRITVVRNGVDTAVFNPQGFAESFGPTAVYAGTMSEWQGADIFVRAWPEVLRHVADAKLVFVGGGSAKREIEALTKQLGVEGSVRFLEVLPPEKAASALRSAHVGLVSIKPELGYDFAIPTKLIASAACGTPVLFAGSGPSAELVADENLGVAVEYEAHEVAQALSRALSSAPTRADRLRIAAWASAHASIAAAGNAAADVVEQAATRSPSAYLTVDRIKKFEI